MALISITGRRPDRTYPTGTLPYSHILGAVQDVTPEYGDFLGRRASDRALKQRRHRQKLRDSGERFGRFCLISPAGWIIASRFPN
ncbi:MAG: hypothetical protein ACPGYL_14640, partial [Rhodospirillaceae bacterium]